ncbi:16S rRNA methyltransferase B [compost metagenome]
MLEAAKHYVKPGGRLVYVTCSLFDEENTRQVERFLSENSNYSEIAPSELWNRVVPEAGAVAPVYPARGSVFSPLSTDTDGFYVSVLQKRG